MQNKNAGEQTHFWFVFITDNGFPIRPKQDDADNDFNPAFKYSVRFNSRGEANAFYVDLLRHIDCLKMFMGIDGYLEGKKEKFIRKELDFFAYEVITNNYVGKIAFSFSTTGTTKSMDFKKESLNKILNIIY